MFRRKTPARYAPESLKKLAMGLSLALSLSTLASTRGQDVAQTYVSPWLFSGSLYVSTAGQLNQHQRALLAEEFNASEGSLVTIGSPADSSATETTATELETFLRGVKWQSVAAHSAESLGEPAEQERMAESLEQLDTDSCVWIDDRALGSCDPEARRWLGQQLRSCLQREVTVCLDRSGSTSHSGDGPPASEPIAADLDLLPQMQLLAVDEDIPAPAGGERLNIGVPDDAWIRIRGRELFNLSSASSLTFTYPECDSRAEESVLRLPSRAMCDLVAMRRTLYERTESPFPADAAYDHRLPSGSLVIVGGGGTSLEIWHKFIELAGGADAKIVVLPTALAEPEQEPYEARVFERLGVGDVRVLPQTDRDAVSDPQYLENFRSATGVWFGGGRQWRFVDAYWGTPAWQAIIDVAGRGGVIGGSSAGATIQGDLLVRGHPLGNQIMVADGYRRGLGLLPGVAIDQHFRQRNRFDDLAQVVQRFPSILGVGIDEDTALVVEAPSKCSVIGKGSVWLSRPGHQQQPPGQYTEYHSGSHFDLIKP